ncbi:hypothetical protein B0H34DRAFT_857770 [Crassisporium funariophilum]|nr:hypothetical protein B0H34DRAFT_857770 [Crassisporium funariophilum]
MLSPTLRASRRLAPCRSLLHQHLTLRHASTSTGQWKRSDSLTKLNSKDRRTAFVKTWEPFQNIADTWALLRVLERKYGKIVEAHFLKDFEMPNRYQTYSYVIFEKPESLQRIPMEGHTFAIPAPNVSKQPGGIGLEDIGHLLESTDRDEYFELPSAASSMQDSNSQRTIGLRIERASTSDYYTIPHLEHEPQYQREPVMRAFMSWGGFHELKPIESSRHISEAEIFGPTDLDHVRMRAALQECSNRTRLPNPAVIRPPRPPRAPSAVAAEANSWKAPANLIQDDTTKVQSAPISLSVSENSASTEPIANASVSEPESQPTPTSKTPPPLSASQTQKKSEEEIQTRKALLRQIKEAKMSSFRAKPQKKKKAPIQEKQEGVELPPLEEEEAPQPKGILDNIWGLFRR